MKKNSCKTYFYLVFDMDETGGADLAVNTKIVEEAEKFIVNNFGIVPEFSGRGFIIGNNENYNIDVNEMLRVTLKDLLGKEEKIREMQSRFCVSAVLEIVPQIVAQGREPHQYLSLERDIIEFLYKSGADVDLDYYII